MFKSAGIKTYDLMADQNGINPNDITALYKKHRIRMIFLNPIFQNPTGTLMSEERRKKVIELSSEYGIPDVEDDPYSLTSFTGEKFNYLKSLLNGESFMYLDQQWVQKKDLSVLPFLGKKK